jgi:hypothetical protein
MRAMCPMGLVVLTRALAVTLVVALVGTSGPVQAQERQHVVSLSELSKDSAVPAETRQANEAAEAASHLRTRSEGAEICKH